MVTKFQLVFRDIFVHSMDYRIWALEAVEGEVSGSYFHTMGADPRTPVQYPYRLDDGSTIGVYLIDVPEDGIETAKQIMERFHFLFVSAYALPKR